ncbi:Acyl-CoA hydrolase [Halogeometricum rufum]|uniref:Acyl-CoA hydrolase n=1 Tax=Halogeometricum rufum TaxID=553469 RepID=A0A1I6FWE8_9EURY|nr:MULTISPECIES: acyl-CoA thioesterase [Halogeometricum]MUV58336.1 acyl-CoA thioesterase [Halogeometricum sp. CBA1124]SFR34127.1 Acyl-CoA hydrolase [Halogeometricum rufum]
MATQRTDGEAVSLRESFTEMSEILMPNDTNNLGRALGGTVLHWMDICGAIAARRFSKRQVVTASMDHVDFLAPIELGDVVTVTGYVFDTGRTSMDVHVAVRAERPSDGVRRETASSFFSFVALDETESPAAVPTLRCPSASQTGLRDEALERRNRRRAELADELGGE